MRAALGNKFIRVCVLGSAWFWFMGAVYLSQFANLAKFNLNADEKVITFFSGGVFGGYCQRVAFGVENFAR